MLVYYTEETIPHQFHYCLIQLLAPDVKCKQEQLEKTASAKITPKTPGMQSLGGCYV